MTRFLTWLRALHGGQLAVLVLVLWAGAGASAYRAARATRVGASIAQFSGSLSAVATMPPNVSPDWSVAQRDSFQAAFSRLQVSQRAFAAERADAAAGFYTEARVFHVVAAVLFLVPFGLVWQWFGARSRV